MNQRASMFEKSDNEGFSNKKTCRSAETRRKESIRISAAVFREVSRSARTFTRWTFPVWSVVSKTQTSLPCGPVTSSSSTGKAAGFLKVTASSIREIAISTWYDYLRVDGSGHPRTAASRSERRPKFRLISDFDRSSVIQPSIPSAVSPPSCATHQVRASTSSALLSGHPV